MTRPPVDILNARFGGPYPLEPGGNRRLTEGLCPGSQRARCDFVWGWWVWMKGSELPAPQIDKSLCYLRFPNSGSALALGGGPGSRSRAGTSGLLFRPRSRRDAHARLGGKGKRRGEFLASRIVNLRSPPPVLPRGPGFPRPEIDRPLGRKLFDGAPGIEDP